MPAPAALLVFAGGLFALSTVMGVIEAISEQDIKIFGYVLSLGAAPASAHRGF